MNTLPNSVEVYERLDFIEFRQELLFNNSEVDRILFEYKITKRQYTDIMNIMDGLRENINNKIPVNNSDYEQKIYNAVSHLHGDYHFCEYIAEAFMNERRWDEVFPALYSNMPKYKNKFKK